MSPWIRYAGNVFALVLVVFIGWRAVATRVSDWLATGDPLRALAWDSRNPDALLTLAQQQLRNGRPDRAAATARALLRIEPLQADSFGIIARAAEATGETTAARRLYAIALRRAPRDEYVRAWTIGDQLQHSDYASALHNVDVLFGIAPMYQRDLMPLLTRAAGSDPAFAVALGRFLGGQPLWRPAMLDDLLAHASVATVDAVSEVIAATGNGLNDAEAGRWYARLENDGRWDEAYSRWFSRIDVDRRGGLPLVYNGAFQRPATGIGFDWEMRGEPGVQVERVRIGSAFAAQVRFLGRRVDDIGFAQILLLAPGSYQLSFRARAEDLRSEKGMQWDIRCVEGGPVIANSPRLDGSFDWRAESVGFSVPTEKCPAQKLMLVNPGAGGAAKLVSGLLWFGDFRIAPAAMGGL